jgi:8-oxo-dGTP pyrophosphatase MutT (NUDIX family)
LKESNESPFECVTREVGEEIGCDELPTPLRGMPLRVGYYYMFEVSDEFVLAPRDTNEVGEAGWFTLEQMRQMNMNIDASYFRSILGGTS